MESSLATADNFEDVGKLVGYMLGADTIGAVAHPQTVAGSSSKDIMEDSMETKIRGQPLADQTAAAAVLHRQQQQNQAPHLHEQRDFFMAGESMLPSIEFRHAQLSSSSLQALSPPVSHKSSWSNPLTDLGWSYDTLDWTLESSDSNLSSIHSLTPASSSSRARSLPDPSSSMDTASSTNIDHSTTYASPDINVNLPDMVTTDSVDLWYCNYAGCTKSFSHQHKLK